MLVYRTKASEPCQHKSDKVGNSKTDRRDNQDSRNPGMDLKVDEQENTKRNNWWRNNNAKQKPTAQADLRALTAMSALVRRPTGGRPKLPESDCFSTMGTWFHGECKSSLQAWYRVNQVLSG